MRKEMRRQVLTSGFALCFVLCSMLMVSSQSAGARQATPTANNLPRFGISPVGDYDTPWFEVTIPAGDVSQLTARVSNIGDVAADLRTYATESFNPPNGGFAAAEEVANLSGAAAWINYEAEDFVLQPGETRNKDFSVSVPAGTPPGEYVIALAVETLHPLPVPGSTTLNQIIRSTLSVEITVPGTMTTGFELGAPTAEFTGNLWVIDVPIENLGTARIRPAGELLIAAADGEILSSDTVEMGSVYGGNSTIVRTTLPGQIAPGDYTLSLHLTDAATGASASLDSAALPLSAPVVATPVVFSVNAASITPNADVIQYATVNATIVNNGQAIPMANVTLNVTRNGEAVESYPLATNQALPQGSTSISERYIPLDGWQSGTYTFQLVISAVNGGTETVLSTIDIENQITVP